ncbi:MAG: hypothetical protein K6E49_03130 [Lachnospiraceae bacterium]|nr:hypothetical protein [Lachnospiraceae bacterium]
MSRSVCSRRSLSIISLLYLYIPIVIFLIGWTKTGVCLITLAAIGYAFFSIYKYTGRPENRKSLVRLDPLVTVFAILFFMWIGYYAGWGRWVDQAPDWLKHNAVLSDIVNKSWPVYYTNENERSMLVYYIAQYMVPGLAGKLTNSFRTAEIVMYVWNEAGLFLVFIHTVNLIKADRYVMQFITALTLPFFGIPLWISEYILRRVSDFNRIGEGFWFFGDGDFLIQYSNNFTLLRWVVPQVIPCWIIMALFLEYRDEMEFHVPIALPGILFGTLSFLGMIPFIIANDLELIIRNRDIKKSLRRLFGDENILVMLTLGVILGMYFYGNVFSEKPETVSLTVLPYDSRHIVYFVFVFVNIIIYALVLWKDNGTDIIFFIMTAVLVLLPLLRMGAFNDLVMRSSIPGLFILMILVLKFINDHMAKADRHARDSVFMKLSVLTVIILFITGLFYPFTEFSEAVKANDDSKEIYGFEWTSLEEFANRDLHINDDMKYNYYAYDIDSNLFYRHIARKKF